jgi:hypothetical protein
MARLGGRPRLGAALVALSLVLAPLLMAVPVQAEVDCSPTLSMWDGEPDDDAGIPEVFLDGTWPQSLQLMGEVEDPCPGDGWFDSGTDAYIKDMHGSVTLPDGTIDRNFEFYSGPGDGIAFEAAAAFDKDRYKQFSVLGRATLTAWASDGIHRWISGSITFHIRRTVGFFSFNASPEPVRKGSPLKLTGNLKRLTFDASGKATYVPFSGQRVDLYFRRRADPPYEEYYNYVSSTTTTSTGNFTKTVTATYDGCWKPASPQTGRHAGRWSARWDCVDVQ